MIQAAAFWPHFGEIGDFLQALDFRRKITQAASAGGVCALEGSNSRRRFQKKSVRAELKVSSGIS